MEYQEKGFKQFQMKVGEEPSLDIKRIKLVSQKMIAISWILSTLFLSLGIRKSNL